MGDIGPNPRKIEFWPLPDEETPDVVQEPEPAQEPVQEPAEAPEKVPA